MSGGPWALSLSAHLIACLPFLVYTLMPSHHLTGGQNGLRELSPVLESSWVDGWWDGMGGLHAGHGSENHIGVNRSEVSGSCPGMGGDKKDNPEPAELAVELLG